VEFELLGPLAVRSEGVALPLGGGRQRALLGLLLVHANEVVPSDRIVDELWPDAEPDAATRSLHVYVSSLRKALGAGSSVLVTRSPGYVLEAPPEAIDARRFERLAADGGAALAAGDADRAAVLLRAALDLWRGTVLADVAGERFATLEAARLEDLRVAALEDLLAAEVALGRHEQALPQLERLVAAEPLRERPRAQLMLALYRSGRQAEALEVYRQTRRLLVDELGIEPGAELRRLEQAILAQAPEIAPPSKSHHGLPAPPSRLVGREDELEELTALLLREDVRLVTLTGPGGVGKTRLAIEAALRLDDRLTGGSFFVDVAFVRSAALLLPTVARTLSVVPEPGESDIDAIARLLRRRPTLLVLDNLEQVVEGAPLIADLLAAAPSATVLATSRVTLRLQAEHEHAVPPLRADDSVALFCRRAKAVQPSFRPSPAIAEICARLEGLPLAIELAAARTRVLRPEVLLERLERRLPMLVGGARDLPERQRTLEATIAWSYELLAPDERAALLRFSVFVEGSSLEAAEDLCESPIEVLEALVDNSLVRVADGRFVMLDTIREYAAARLSESPDEERVRARHLAWFRALAESAEPELPGERQLEWLARLQDDQANLRAAIGYALSSGRGDDALATAAALRHFWWVRAHYAVGRRLLEDALAAAGQGNPSLRERGLTGVGILAAEQGDLAAASDAFEEALALARAEGDRGRVAAGLANLGNIAYFQGDVARAREAYLEGLELARETGAFRRLATLSENLGLLELSAGNFDGALARIEEAIDAARSAGDLHELAACLRSMGRVCFARGELETAESHFLESLELVRSMHDQRSLADWLEGWATGCSARGDHTRCVLLLGAADALREAISAARAPDYRRWYDELLAAAASVLPADALASALADGRLLTAEAAVVEALDAG
jgi:predicted ATPase/DNA-binding SARP family transcriptional activator